MTENQRNELELIADLALAKADLKVTKEVGKIRVDLASIPPMMDQKIKTYDLEQTSRRRWTIRTVLTTLGLTVSIIAFIFTQWT